ncbi:MAG: IS3 family transposase [Candidatus Ancaeobacter aquaticus]|nr:IS3 family transposase [Candidatus Ancaeobacter aquaticus]
MCRVLRVSASGYYAWKSRPVSKRSQIDQYLVAKIQDIHVESKKNYGTIKTWKALKARGISCGKYRVARL